MFQHVCLITLNDDQAAKYNYLVIRIQYMLITEAQRDIYQI